MIKNHTFTIATNSTTIAQMFIDSGAEQFYSRNSSYFADPKSFKVEAVVKQINKQVASPGAAPFAPTLVDVKTTITGTKKNIASWIMACDIKSKAASSILGGL